MNLTPLAREIIAKLKNGTMQLYDCAKLVYANPELKQYIHIFMKILYPTYLDPQFDMQKHIISNFQCIDHTSRNMIEEVKIWSSIITDDDLNRVHIDYNNIMNIQYEYTFLSAIISDFSGMMPWFYFVVNELNITKDKITEKTMDCVFEKLRINMAPDYDTRRTYREATYDAECIGYLHHIDVLSDYIKKNNYENLKKAYNTTNACVYLAVTEWLDIPLSTLPGGFIPVISYSYNDHNDDPQEVSLPE